MFFPSPFSLVALSTCLLSTTLATILIPIRPPPSTSTTPLTRRFDKSALSLRSSETFLWGSLDSSPTSPLIAANLSLYFPSSTQNILSMERFDGMLLSTVCSETEIKLTFRDDDTFGYAKEVWDWVNGEEDHAFVMVAGQGDCGWNGERQPFLVRSLRYDEPGNVATLGARMVEWVEVATSYDLRVGRVDAEDVKRRDVGRRDIAKEISLGMARQYQLDAKIERAGVYLQLECDGKDGCSTSGSLNMELRITQGVIGIPDGAKMRLKPRGLGAQAKLKVTGTVDLKEKIEWLLPKSLDIPLNSINIPGGILNIGPKIEVTLGAELAALSGSASLTGGARVSIPDSSLIEVDLLNPLNNKFSGWTPQMSLIPFSVDAKLAGTLQLFVQTGLVLSAEAFNKGFEIGLKLKAPTLEGKFEALASPQGVCQDKQHTLGVNLELAMGAELALEAGKANGGGDLFEVTIASNKVKLGEKCWNFGPLSTNSGGGGGGGGSSPPPPTSNACTNNAGVTGQCISTSACSSKGGKSEAGHCPGDRDIQCCTGGTTSPGNTDYGTCTANGVAGTCISTSACTGVTTRGLCPGGADIQCCTSESCKTKAGVSGTCMATSACKGTSTPGLCSGPTNIQCCTTSTSPGNTDYGTCTANGVAGTCISTSACTGVTTRGLCPGGADIQCCTSETCKTKAGVSGTCMATSACKGTSTPGLCSGPTNIQCCTTSSTTPSNPDYGVCKTKAGVAGTCISTSSCKGTSTPGLCPGGQDIQCCTPSSGSPGNTDYGSCKAAGVSGTCISTSACTGTSTPGLCPGPSEIQCCTPKASTSPAGSKDGECKNNAGLVGECISTSACSGNGGTSEAGHCPGLKDIQCCTYGSCTVSGKRGLCQPSSTCKGTSSPGKCPGGADIQCCTA